MEIIPTTSPQTDFLAVEKKISELKEISSWVQIDVTDGSLVKPATFSLELLNRLDPRPDNLLFDIHLMVKEPLNWIKKCLHVQASRIYGQVEKMSDRCQFISEAKDNGLEVGLAFDLDTPIDVDFPCETDIILLMGRPMGFTTYPFDLSVFPKIDFFKDRGYKVAIDGGVTPELFPKLKQHGVDIIYSGEYYLDLKNAHQS